MGSTKQKLLYLLEYFYRHTDSEHRCNALELAEKLSENGIETERKSIYRDIATLQEYGFDIKKSSTGYYLDQRVFKPAEIRILISAVQTASFLTAQKTAALTNKLTGFLSRYQAETLLQQCNMGSIKCDNEEVYATIEAINLAIATHKQIAFSYYKRDINKHDTIQRHGERFVVNPYAMIWLQDRYYLVSNMASRNDLTHFRLDRMKNVALLQTPARHFSEVSDYTTTFQAADYAARCVNMFGGESESITLRCNMSILNEVFDRFGNTAVIRKENEMRFIATVHAAASHGFLAWVAQFGANIEIVSPRQLRKQMKQHLSEALLQYQNES